MKNWIKASAITLLLIIACVLCVIYSPWIIITIILFTLLILITILIKDELDIVNENKLKKETNNVKD